MEIFTDRQAIALQSAERLYRAVTKTGDTIDFYLSRTRNAQAAKRFLAKALRPLKDWEKPYAINTPLVTLLSNALSGNG